MAANGTPGKPTVVIIGAGAAGIFTAYQINKLWPGEFNVQILEAGQVIGGNVSSVTVEYGGQTYIIDAGAQFFYNKPQPLYVQLIKELGLFDQVASYATGLTVWDSATKERLLWIPSAVSGFFKYGLADWARLVEFGTFLVAATVLNGVGQPDWSLSVQNWLADLPLDDVFKQNVIKSFLYQFVSLPLDRIDEASAVYATTYFVRNVFGDAPAPTDPTAQSGTIPTFQTYQSLIGLEGILQQAATASGFTPQLGSPVTAVAPGIDGVAVTANGQTFKAQYVVMACDPNTSARLLTAGGTASSDLIEILRQLEYLELYISLQQNGSCWMPITPPNEPDYWEPVTTVVDSQQQTVVFNAWFGPLRPPYGDNGLIPVFKSWGAPNLQSSPCQHTFYSHSHNVLLPTTTFMALRNRLVPFQGQNGLFFAGGWTNWFDSQEAALMSAITVAEGLQPSGRVQQQSQLARGSSATALSVQVKSWVELVSQDAPAPYKSQLVELAGQLA